MSFKASLVVVLLCLAVWFGFAAVAQQPAAPGATVHGLILDPDNALVPNATVTLAPASGKAQVSTSKSDGTYVFRGVAPGTYSVKVAATGFAPYLKEAVTVASGSNLAIDARLSIMEATQQMLVTADTPTVSVDPDSGASTTVISGAALDAISDDPNELQSELQALAGPSSGPNGGQIYIDGFANGTLPPKASISEIRVNQNPFSAQYDQLGYGRIEIITKPGTDTLHGNLSFQFGDKIFNTSNPFLGTANTQPDYHTIFLLGSLSGAMRKNMSFSLSGSYRDIQNNAIINPTAIYSNPATPTTVCIPAAAGCSSNPYPTTARAVPNPQTMYELSPRVDIGISSKNTLTTRFTYDNSSSTNNGSGSSLPSTGGTSSSVQNDVQLDDTQQLGSKVINETQFEYQRSTSNSTPFSTDPSIIVQGFFTAGGSGGGNINSTISDYEQVQNYTSISLLKNFIRLGGRVRSSEESVNSNSNVNGSFTYSYLLDPCADSSVSTDTQQKLGCFAPGLNDPSPCAYLQAANNPNNQPLPSSYQCDVLSQFSITTINKQTVAARETDVGLYAEDDWKARNNLTVSYGLRFEAQNWISSAHDLGPRTAIAYGIPRKNGNPTTVLRAGFGIFFTRFGLSDIMADAQNNGTNQIRGVFTSPSSLSGCVPTGTGTSGCPTATAPSAAINIDSQGPGLRSAYTLQTAATIEQQLGKYASVSATYLNGRGLHQLILRDFPALSKTPSQYDYQYQSGGVFQQNQINTNFNVRTPKGLMIFGYYSVNWANSNISNVTNPYNSHVDFGRAGFAVRNRFVIGGSIPLPLRITASPLIFANAGSPYNVITGLDENGDGQYNDRPAFIPGVTPNCWNASTFNSNPTGNYTEIPVNYCTGPATVTINLRLAKTFGIGPKTEAALAAERARAAGGPGGGPIFGGGPGGPGGPRGGGGGGGRAGSGGGGPMGFGGTSDRKYNLTIGAQASNLFNEVPYGTPVASLNNPTFFGKETTLQQGLFASASAVRRIMLQATFSF